MKTTIIFATFVLLAGCATPQQAPVIDTKAIPAEKMLTFQQDSLECKAIQLKAMPVNLIEALGTNDVQAYNRRYAEKAALIVRECLKGRGYPVLY